MLQGMTWAAPPDLRMPAATSSQASALRGERTPLAPSFARSSAEARPMPRLEPVMTATLPVRSKGVDFMVVSDICFVTARSSRDEAIQSFFVASGLLRCARNDGADALPTDKRTMLR